MQHLLKRRPVRTRPAWLVVAVVFMDGTGSRPTSWCARRKKGTSWDALGTSKLWKELWKWSLGSGVLVRIHALTRKGKEHPQRDSNPCRHLERVDDLTSGLAHSEMWGGAATSSNRQSCVGLWREKPVVTWPLAAVRRQLRGPVAAKSEGPGETPSPVATRAKSRRSYGRTLQHCQLCDEGAARWRT